MDPNAAWSNLKAAVQDAQWGLAAEIAEDLFDWLSVGGFPPRITGDNIFDAIVARATTEAIISWDVVVH